MFCPPTFSGVDVFCTNAPGIYWMIGAIFVKFSQLILVKILKIVATRCQILRLKCTKFNLQRSPRLPNWM